MSKIDESMGSVRRAEQITHRVIHSFCGQRPDHHDASGPVGAV